MQPHGYKAWRRRVLASDDGYAGLTRDVRRECRRLYLQHTKRKMEAQRCARFRVARIRIASCFILGEHRRSGRCYDAIVEPAQHARHRIVVTEVASNPLAVIVIALVVDRGLVLTGVWLFHSMAALARRRGPCTMRPISTVLRGGTGRHRLDFGRVSVICAAPHDRMREQAKHGELRQYELHQKVSEAGGMQYFTVRRPVVNQLHAQGAFLSRPEREGLFVNCSKRATRHG